MVERLLPKILHKGDLIYFLPKVLMKNIEDETGLKREDSFKIVNEVMRQFIASHIKETTKPMIREKTCSVMVDLGYLEARKDYTRIGMSMYQAKAIFNVNYPIEAKMRQVYDHMEQEFKGVRELKYE